VSLPPEPAGRPPLPAGRRKTPANLVSTCLRKPSAIFSLHPFTVA
jgi:hypothetical protein